MTTLSRYLICSCCAVAKAVTHAPETKEVKLSNGIYEAVKGDPICEKCANVLGWEVEPE